MTKLLTHFELAAHSVPELQALMHDLFNDLAASEPGTAKRRNALASLDNVRREMAIHHQLKP